MRKIFILLCVIVSFVCCGDNTMPAVPGLPGKIGKLDLRDVEKGVTANKLMYRMHGKITGGRNNSIIGYYGADNTKNVLYLSAFENDTQAERTLKPQYNMKLPGRETCLQRKPRCQEHGTSTPGIQRLTGE